MSAETELPPSQSTNPAPSLSQDGYAESAAPPPPPQPQTQPGLLWRLGSGVVGTAAGAVTGVAGTAAGAVTGAAGYGFGAVKWTASKGYNLGAAVANKVPRPPIPGMKKTKDKSD